MPSIFSLLAFAMLSSRWSRCLLTGTLWSQSTSSSTSLGSICASSEKALLAAEDDLFITRECLLFQLKEVAMGVTHLQWRDMNLKFIKYISILHSDFHHFTLAILQYRNKRGVFFTQQIYFIWITQTNLSELICTSSLPSYE